MLELLKKKPFKDLLSLNKTLLSSNLILLGGYSGIGKSEFGISYSSYLSSILDKKVLYFTLEMLEDEVSEIEGKNHYKELVKNSKSNLKTYESDGILEHIKNKILNKKDTGLIVIDFFQLMEEVSVDKEITKEKINSILQELKILSREINLPIILITQLTKIEGFKKPKPHYLCLMDYKIADLILLFYREESTTNIFAYEQDELIGNLEFTYQKN